MGAEEGPAVFCSRKKIRLLGVVFKETLIAVHVPNLRNLLPPRWVYAIELILRIQRRGKEEKNTSCRLQNLSLHKY